MTALIALVLGGAVGVGLVVALAGLRGVALVDRPRIGTDAALAPRFIAGFVGAAGAWFLVGWPAVVVGAACLGWWGPMLWAGRHRHDEELALVEAIATWTEQLRDTLAAANGLEHAIGATAPLAPRPISAAVGRLAARVEYDSLSGALRRFADDVDHPVADFVVAALVTAAEREARDIGPLLGHLAVCARDEARMRTRVWVGRARTRSAVRIIVSVVVVFVTGLFLLDRDYLAPYDDPVGQIVLAGVISLFAGAIVTMDRMSRFAVPERFVRRREVLS
jgi:tight adherence protein B